MDSIGSKYKYMSKTTGVKSVSVFQSNLGITEGSSYRAGMMAQSESAYLESTGT